MNKRVEKILKASKKETQIKVNTQIYKTNTSKDIFE